MRRLLSATAVVAACAATVAVLGTGASSGSGSYRVRAIFDNAFSVIPGEDVKVAGVKVGKIDSLDVTGDQKAAVVLDITSRAFQDFRTDATCTIRPQSLIGEKFVECSPTQQRVEGTPEPPALARIAHGRPGAGQYLLPSTQTSRPVDLDLINDTLRMPYAQRLSIILDEFGTGLAGRGGDLRQVIRKADPALAETDRVLNILAQQNQVLDRLAVNSDTSLAPIARERARVAHFIGVANTTAQATAERGAALQAGLQRFPRFLSELRPTMVRLGAFADQATPVFTDLGSQGRAISRLIQELGPFSKAATPALKSLGQAADVGRVALPAALPIVTQLRTLAANAKPLATNLAALTTSLHDSGGIERLLDYAFYQEAAINGFDAVGHYLRAGLIVNLCSTYATTNSGSCSANFKSASTSARTASARSVATAGRSPYLVNEDRALRGLPFATAAPRRGSSASPRAGALALPRAILPGSAPSSSPSPSSSSPSTSGGAAAPSAPPPPVAPGGGSATTLLGYLLGNG